MGKREKGENVKVEYRKKIRKKCVGELRREKLGVSLD